MRTKDPYEILGVPRNASQEEIKRAYRRLAKENHPDRNPGNPQAGERFKEVQAAYEVLGDAGRREQFDRFGAGGPPPDFRAWDSVQGGPAGDAGFDFGDLNSIFEQFFSQSRAGRSPRRRAPARPPARGADLEYEVEITFEESLRGTTRELRLALGPETERIQFRIPRGVADGQRIRLAGRGHPGPGGRGDLIIHVRVHEHPLFRREGLDLLLDLPLRLSEAALGAKIEIPTLDGPTRLTIPPGTASHTRLRLRGKGVHDERSGRTGDLYVIARIVPPRRVTDEQRTLLERLDRLDPTNPRAEWSRQG